MGKTTKGKKYLIDEELRETLLNIIKLLQKHSDKHYWKGSDKYTDELRLGNGNIIPLPFLSEIQTDLQEAEEVIATDEYNCSAEELLIIAREMGLL